MRSLSISLSLTERCFRCCCWSIFLSHDILRSSLVQTTHPASSLTLFQRVVEEETTRETGNTQKKLSHQCNSCSFSPLWLGAAHFANTKHATGPLEYASRELCRDSLIICKLRAIDTHATHTTREIKNKSHGERRRRDGTRNA